MRDLLGQRRAEGRACLIFLHAPEGMGCFSLASEFYHDDPAAFDSCFVVTARQPDGGLVPKGDMLAQALRGLGFDDTKEMASEAARGDTFQRLSAGRRFLMIIEDVASAEQVRGMIPNSAPGAALVVTTRTMLRALLVEDFTDIPLGLLPQAETRELLSCGLGATASEIPAGTLHELADLCGGFPLLVRILAAHLARRPRATARVLAELRASEAALLTMDSGQRITRFLDLAYESLGELQIPYRQLAALPGPSFGMAAAAAAFGTGSARAEQYLDGLVDANLLTYDDESDRYSCYPIIRADARGRAQEFDGPDRYRSAVSRNLTWYLNEAVPRDAALGRRWRVGRAFEEYAASNAEPIRRADAIAWWDAEWRSIVDCVAVAHTHGLHDIAVQMCVAVYKYLHMHGHYDPWSDSHRLGIMSAEASGEVLGLLQLGSQRGAALLAVGELTGARADFEASYDAAVRAGHIPGEQSALEWRGKVAAAERSFWEAMEFYDRSEAVIDRAGEALGDEQPRRMRALLDLQRARAWVALQAWEEAERTGRRAVAYFEPSGESENHAKCLKVLGEAALGRGDEALAAARFEAAVALFDGDGARRASAGVRRLLGDALLTLGRKSDAAEMYRHAHGTFAALFDAAADDVAERLAALSE